MLPNSILGDFATNKFNSIVNYTAVTAEKKSSELLWNFLHLHKVSVVVKKKIVILLPSKTLSLCVKSLQK